MDAETKIVNGGYRIDAQGDLEMVCRGDCATIQAESGKVHLTAAEEITLSSEDTSLQIKKNGPLNADILAVAGFLGKILLAGGAPEVGPRVEIDGTSVTLANGPPLGAQIELTLKGITISYGVVSITLNPLLGIELKTAETTLNIGAEGITSSAPITRGKALAVVQEQATLLNSKVDGMKKSQNSIEMRTP